MIKTELDKYGSFRVDGPKYSVVQFRGPVAYRQAEANRMRVLAYLEAHCNAMGKPVANSVFAIAAYNHSVPLGKLFSKHAAAALGIRDDGVQVAVKGSGLVSRVRWPAEGLVLEPGFISNPDFADQLVNGGGIACLGAALARAVSEYYPTGGLIGGGVGHAYRFGEGNDQGALAAEMENPAFDRESEIAEAYWNDFTERLTALA